MTSDRYRARSAASQQWQRNPAGTFDVEARRGTPEFFESMARSRYEGHSWIRDLIRTADHRGRVLEIGCGAGQDNQVLGETATVIGIDLAHEGAHLTDTLRRMEGRSGGALVADAEHMPFTAHAFDGVYSMGVIHHTDHPEKVAAEMRRVVRPGGRITVALYHRWSLFTGVKVIEWLRTGRAESWRDHLALLEKGAEQLDERPVVLLYGRRGARALFEGFEDVRTTVRHFGVDHPGVERLVPATLRRPLARLFGWYVIVLGVRPLD